MTDIAKIYTLVKMLDNLEIKLFEYEMAKNMEDDAYGHLWYEEKLKSISGQIEFVKSELRYLVDRL